MNLKRVSRCVRRGLHVDKVPFRNMNTIQSSGVFISRSSRVVDPSNVTAVQKEPGVEEANVPVSYLERDANQNS